MCVCVCNYKQLFESICIICKCITHTHIYIYTSSSSCRAATIDIPDPLSPLLPIIHRLW